MKKISTLAVALMTLGSLVTPAQADVVPTSTLPSGYYKITSAAYSSAEDSNFPWGYMLNDYFLEGNTNHATLLAKSFKDNANNYIWKITNDGKAASFAIVNGQGTPIKREDGASGSYTYKEHSTLTPSLSNSDATANTYLFSEYLNTPGTNDPNHGYGNGAYKAVAYWGGEKGSTTKWKLENLNISDENVYTVSIVTTSSSTTKPYITRTLIDGTKEYAFNSGFFISDADLDVTSLAASTLEGYENPDIKVDYTAKTVTAYYAKFDDLTALITSATDLLNTRGVGYPLSASAAHIRLASAIDVASSITAASSAKDCAEAYTILQNAITNYHSTTTDIQMPEDGKVYKMYALWDDGKKVYAANIAGHTVNSKFSTKGILNACPTDNTGYWIIQKNGDVYTIVSATADNVFTYVNQAKQANTAVSVKLEPSRMKEIGRLNLLFTNRFGHIVMYKDGSKMGEYTTAPATSFSGDWSSEWVFEEVTDFAGQTVNFAASTDSKNYATLNLPYASTLPTGVTAYKATVEGTTVNLTEYKTENQVLPANTPVLLTATSAGSKTFVPAAYEAADNTTGFQGTLAATAVDATNTYILSQKDGKVNFFALDETNNTINANKAYLVVPAGGAQALNFNFGNTTGIQNAAVEGVNANAPLFDLSGRRVVKAVKGGIYIQNGKKFVK